MTYGLEFMGKEWDKLDAGLPQENAWKGRRGKGGSGVNTPDPNWKKFEHTPRVSYGGKPSAFKRCAKCGRRQFSGTPCVCDEPEWVIEHPEGAPSSSIRMQRWHEAWAREAIRVLKPGGFCVAFGGTRTHHRLMCAIEDAGFEIRDTIGHMHAGPSLGVYAWNHAQGFPKGKDFAKDDAASRAAGHRVPRPEFVGTPFEEGWNVALKPAWEIILLARKPLVGSVAENVLRHGVGGLNVDRCRVGHVSDGDRAESERKNRHTRYANPHSNRDSYSGDFPPRTDYDGAKGRWPPNTLLTHHPDCLRLGTRRVKGGNGVERASSRVGYDGGFSKQDGRVIGYADADGTEETTRYACVPECPIRLLDAQAGRSVSRKGAPRRSAAPGNGYGMVHTGAEYDDEGNASRFFPTFAWAAGEVEEATRFRYQSKASTRERGCGLPDGMTNTNPCVKPVALLRWITRLVCPPNGTVLDPFAGSGSEGLACLLEGFDYVGVEMSEEYAAIARARLAHVARHGERWLEMAGVPDRQPTRTYGNGEGLGDPLARCPEHDTPRLTNGNTYACGCSRVRVAPRSAPRHNVPPAVTPDYADLPLFAKTGDD